MNEEVLVRRYQDSDLDDVYETIQLAFHTAAIEKVYEPEKYEIWSELYSKEAIAGLAKLRHLYVAEYKNKIVGCIAVMADGEYAYISTVYTHKNYQGLGIGSKLFEAAEQDEICVKAGKLKLHAILTAVKFYKRMGFTFEEECPTVFMDTGTETITMIKLLKP